MPINIVLKVNDASRVNDLNCDPFECAQWEEESDLLSTYNYSYTVAALKAIAGYYGIHICGRRKSQLAAALVRYETDPSHQEEVARRRGLWSAAELLKSDPFFSSRVILDC